MKIVPCVVRTWVRSLYRSKSRTVAAGGGEEMEKVGWKTGQRNREEWQKSRAERSQREQRGNDATALKETEADLTAPWH